MIGTLFGLAATGVGSVLGAVRSKRAGQAAEAEATRAHDAAQQYYNSELAADYLQRPDVRGILSNQREIMAEAYRQARGTSAVAGGSEEDVARAKALSNKSLADSTSSIAASAAGHKDAMAAQAASETTQYHNKLAGIREQTGKAIADATGRVINAGTSMIATDKGQWDWLMKGKKKDEEGTEED